MRFSEIKRRSDDGWRLCAFLRMLRSAIKAFTRGFDALFLCGASSDAAPRPGHDMMYPARDAVLRPEWRAMKCR